MRLVHYATVNKGQFICLSSINPSPFVSGDSAVWVPGLFVTGPPAVLGRDDTARGIIFFLFPGKMAFSIAMMGD